MIGAGNIADDACGCNPTEDITEKDSDINVAGRIDRNLANTPSPSPVQTRDITRCGAGDCVNNSIRRYPANCSIGYDQVTCRIDRHTDNGIEGGV